MGLMALLEDTINFHITNEVVGGGCENCEFLGVGSWVTRFF